MREDEILPKIVSDIEAEVASDVEVYTSGHDAVDAKVDPPEVVIDWQATRLPNAGGHTARQAYTTDANGDKNKYEHHSYWEFRADCLIRYEDEIKRDKIAHNIQMAFLPYEGDATKFNADTREWEIGSTEPRPMLSVEPDWYENGIVVSFEYIKRTTEDADIIGTVNTNYNNDETIDSVSTDIKTN